MRHAKGSSPPGVIVRAGARGHTTASISSRSPASRCPRLRPAHRDRRRRLPAQQQQRDGQRQLPGERDGPPPWDYSQAVDTVADLPLYGNFVWLVSTGPCSAGAFVFYMPSAKRGGVRQPQAGSGGRARDAAGSAGRQRQRRGDAAPAIAAGAAVRARSSPASTPSPHSAAPPPAVGATAHSLAGMRRSEPRSITGALPVMACTWLPDKTSIAAWPAHMRNSVNEQHDMAARRVQQGNSLLKHVGWSASAP